MYHQKCSTLLYDTYINIVVNNDITLLAISGRPTLDQLKDAWQDILQEYSSLIKSEKAKTIFEAWRKCVYTDWQIKYIESVLFRFRMKNPETGEYLWSEEHSKRVLELGYTYIEAPEQDGEEYYLNQLEGLDLESRNLTIFLNQYTAEYKALCPKEENPVERTVGDFDTELAVLSKFMGTWLDKKTKTVADVCAVINVHNQYIDLHKKQMQDHGG